MYEIGDVRMVVTLLILLSATAGYYAGKYHGFMDGQRAILRLFHEQQARANAEEFLEGQREAQGAQGQQEAANVARAE